MQGVNALTELLAEVEAHRDAGRLDLAQASVARALHQAPADPRVLCAQADLLARTGRRDRAATVLRRAAAAAPRDPEPVLALARLTLEGGDPASAMRLFDAVRQAAPHEPRAWEGLSESLSALNHPAEARAVARQGTQVLPHSANLHLAAAHLALAQAGVSAAVEALERGRGSVPRDPRLAARLGLLLLQSGRPADARPHLAQAEDLDPDDPVLPHNLGIACRALGDLSAARAAGERARQLAPDHPAILASLGNTLSECGEHALAIGVLERAQQTDPDAATARTNLGGALLRAGFPERALERFDAALATHPGLAPAHRLRAQALLARGDDGGARAALEAALAIEPEDGEALALLVSALRRACQWGELGALEVRLDACNTQALAHRRRAPEPPLDHLTRSLDPAENQSIAESWCPQGAPARTPDRPDGPIRVGYLSADMRDHAMGWLLDGLFAAHDRARVHVTLLDVGPEEIGRQGHILRAGCDATLALGRLDDAAAAQAIRDADIHVLVDLMGHTRANRLGVLSRRPAPVQATWLGHPGTTGARFIDYIVLDPVLAPPGEAAAVSEQIARLPCYQANGPLRPLAPPPDRSDEGLPPTGLVLACPNRPEKLDPVSFALWMRILAEVPDTVLWLGPFDDAPTAALRAHAQAAGVDPERLRFAARRSKAAHIRRLQLVDLGLDTLVYGAHTTASDLLRAGAPMLTVRGPTIASRVAASLLTRAGVADTLVVPSAEQYVARAVALLTRPGALDHVRRRVVAGRHRVFDPVAMAGDLEDLYATWVGPG